MLISCSCPSGKRLFRSTALERLGEAAKLPFPIHAHMLRHAAGYAQAARGVDTRTLQAFMGHRSIANTVVYTEVADKRIRNIWGK
jgi:type 1 fimbriae regulatory protein FimB/type 1 fimbriae regulatory protein FimE